MVKKPRLEDFVRELIAAWDDCRYARREDLYESIERLKDDYWISRDGLVEKMATELKELYMEKQRRFRDFEQSRIHQRRAISTGVLCSLGISTLIAEFIAGPLGECDTEARVPIEQSTALYAFGIAIRADWEWPYYTWHASRILRCSDLRATDKFKKIARSIIGEICRLTDNRSDYISPEEYARTVGHVRYSPGSAFQLFRELLGVSEEDDWMFEEYFRKPVRDLRKSRRRKWELTRGNEERFSSYYGSEDGSWILPDYVDTMFDKIYEESEPKAVWPPRRQLD